MEYHEPPGWDNPEYDEEQKEKERQRDERNANWYYYESDGAW